MEESRRALFLLQVGFVLMAMLLGGIVGLSVPAVRLVAGAEQWVMDQVQNAGHWFDAPAPAASPRNAKAVSPVKLSPAFRPEVLKWEPDILKWSDKYGLDPNLVATIMQIESCGDPAAVSPSGATGLFQVMPFHFEAGEDMSDPATNARRGLSYLADSLKQSQGDVGLALAAYNGGQSLMAVSSADWPAETQRYYEWGTGIYSEVSQGSNPSPTLERWLAAGGSSLCDQAAAR